MKKFTPLFLLFFAFAWSAKSQGTLLDAQFVHDDSMRTYKLYVPADYDGSEAWPLVIVLHGYTVDADFMISATGMNAVADTGHFLVAYPQGLWAQLLVPTPPFPDNGTGWNSGGIVVSGNDDVGFLSRMIHKVGLSHKVDPARVYACGLSNGGYMSYRLACELSDRIAAVASVSALMPTDVPCSNGRPIPLMEIHGTADPIVPFDGIPPYNLSIPDGIAFWVDHNGCDATPTVTQLPDLVTTDNSTVTLKSYSNCDAGAEVLLYETVGAGHAWPTPYAPFTPPFLGARNADINASTEIWNFFKKHTHPDPVLTQFPWHAPVVPNPFGTNVPGTFRLRLADFDNDGVKEGTMFFTNGDLRYFENTGTDAAPGFQYVQSFPFGFPQLTNPTRMPYRYVDIDGDCDLDAFLFRIQLGPFGQLEFLENKGTPDAPWFGDSQMQSNPFGFVPPTSDSVASVGLQNVFYTLVDIDADNDFDLFLGGNYPAAVSPSLDENFYFYRNDDPSGRGTSPQFSSPVKNPFGLKRPMLADGIIVPNFTDIDCDGDWDLFVTYAGVAITFIENTGSPGAPDFGSTPVVWMANDPPQPLGFDSYEFGDWLDIGGDGDLDYLTPSTFRENITGGTAACQAAKAQCYPFARVQFIHAADHETVKLVGNGETLREVFAYQTATPFMEVPAGVPLDVEVVVRDPWSTHPDGHFSLYFTPGQTYVVVLQGTFDPNDAYPLALAKFDRGREEGSQNDMVDILSVRGGPDIPVPIDVVVVGGPKLADDVLYGQFGADYVSLPAGSFTLSPTPADNNDIILDPFVAHMGFWKGRTAVVFGTGLVGNGTFQPWVALSNGGTFPLFPPPGAKMQAGSGEGKFAGNLRLSPNPAKEEVQVIFNLLAAGETSLEVFDGSGMKMTGTDLGELPEGYHHFELNVGQLPAGVYYLKLRTATAGVVERLVVVRK